MFDQKTRGGKSLEPVPLRIQMNCFLGIYLHINCNIRCVAGLVDQIARLFAKDNNDCKNSLSLVVQLYER